ncbi:MAG: glycosyltransferase [Bacteroidia bacterium]|nr:glycosyltransferase [Bacteroidia bacterium]
MSGKKLNVLFLTKWYPNKLDIQLGVFVRKHAKAAGLFNNVSLIYLFAAPELTGKYSVKFSQEHGFNEYIVLFKKNTSIFGGLINPLRYFIVSLKVIKQVEKAHGKIDLIQANMLTRSGFIAWWQYVTKGIPYVVMEHWTGYSSGKYLKQSFLKKLLGKFIVKRSQKVMVVSRALKEQMLKLGFENSFDVIPNVIENIELAKKEKEDVIKILTVADQYDAHKNISGILQLAKKISNDPKLKFHWDIIGGGPDEYKLREMANQMNLNQYVSFHGRQTNEYVYEQYKKADFVVINSRLETFSVVAAEALVNGKPIVTTICGGPEEFVTKAQGILIKKDDPELLEMAVRKMMMEYDHFDPVALNSYAMNLFSYKKIGEQFNSLYQEAMK